MGCNAKRSTGRGSSGRNCVERVRANSAAERTEAPIAQRFHTPPPEPASANPGVAPWRKPGFARAFENSRASVNRSAGSFSRALRIAASTLSGIDFRTVVADTGSPWMILPSTACAVLPG